MKAHIRRSDDKPSYEVDIACRYGGEEFAVILPEAVSVQGMPAAERLRRTVEKEVTPAVNERLPQRVATGDKGGMRVTVSIGVSSYPEHGVQIESLIQAADDAMYLAKQRGKNRVFAASASSVVDA